MTDNNCSSPYTCEDCPHEDTDQCDRRPERQCGRRRCCIHFWEVIPVDVKKENEAKKEYLLRYQDAIRVEKQIDEEIKQLRLNAMMPAVVNDGMPHGSRWR